MAITLDGTSGIIVSGNTNTLAGVTVGLGAGAVATNTVLGASALGVNTTGANNVAIGNSAGYSIGSASSCVAVGQGSLGSNVSSRIYSTVVLQIRCYWSSLEDQIHLLQVTPCRSNATIYS